jgi:carbonic anhydrase
MFDLIYRYDPARGGERKPPADAEEARQRLEDGNREFAQLLGATPGDAPAGSRVILFDLEDIGIVANGGAPRQRPFAVVVGCSDARVPTELIFNRACNELFVVRVAGSLIGQEGLGSIDYALEYLGESLKLLVVLGHTGCGAVTAAVDVFLHPTDYLSVASSHPLRAVVNHLWPAVRGAAVALAHLHGPGVEKQPGYRAALVEVAVVFNAALTAAMLREEIPEAESHGLRVVFGVYDLATRLVGVPLQITEAPHAAGLIEPPRDREGQQRLAAQVAGSALVRRLLTGG